MLLLRAQLFRQARDHDASNVHAYGLRRCSHRTADRRWRKRKANPYVLGRGFIVVVDMTEYGPMARSLMPDGLAVPRDGCVLSGPGVLHSRTRQVKPMRFHGLCGVSFLSMCRIEAPQNRAQRKH